MPDVGVPGVLAGRPEVELLDLLALDEHVGRVEEREEAEVLNDGEDGTDAEDTRSSEHNSYKNSTS